MDKLTRYREVVRRLVEEYASHKPPVGDVDTYTMIDPGRDHYVAMQTGWVNHRRRIHGTVLHLDIIDGKIWVQHDGPERPVAEEVAAAGVPKEDIIIAYKPADVRPFTGYGVG